MLGSLLQRSRKAQNFIGVLSWRRLDGDEARASDGQSAGLVEQHRVGARESIERRAALDDDAAPCRVGHAGNEGDGGGEYKRARSSNHQDGKAANGISGQDPSQAGHENGRGQQEQCVTVCQANERGLSRLGSADEADDPGVGAFLGGGGGPYLKRIAGVERAAAGALPRLASDGDGLSGEGQFIDHRRGDVMRPSTGMISPARTRMASPIFTSAMATSSMACPGRRCANLGARSTRDFKLRSARATA